MSAGEQPDSKLFKVEVSPTDKSDDPNRREAFQRFAELFGSILTRGADLTDSYVEGKLKEIHGHGSKEFAEAAKLVAEVFTKLPELDQANQKAVSDYLDNLQKASELPAELRDEAIELVKQTRPNTDAELGMLIELIETLAMTKGFQIGPAPKAEAIASSPRRLPPE